jgi:hypothetical protein
MIAGALAKFNITIVSKRQMQMDDAEAGRLYEIIEREMFDKLEVYAEQLLSELESGPAPGLIMVTDH